MLRRLPRWTRSPLWLADCRLEGEHFRTGRIITVAEAAGDHEKTPSSALAFVVLAAMILVRQIARSS
jgi:hypothetical protein